MNQPNVALSLALATIVALAAWRLRWLTQSGAWAAAVVGGACLAGGGWGAAALLLTFFVTSNVFSRVRSGRRASMDGVVAKGGRRDAWQVLANGGVAAALSVGYGLSGRDPQWLAGIVGSWAAATADTWATEWGAFSRQPPRLITGGGPVPPGTSGGVTALGWLGSAAGGLLIGCLAAIIWGHPLLAAAGLMAGLVGSLVDSSLGAKAQAVYRCPQCNALTEQSPTHVCGSPTMHAQGIPWIGNDVVNLLASLSGAAAGSAIVLLG